MITSICSYINAKSSINLSDNFFIQITTAPYQSWELIEALLVKPLRLSVKYDHQPAVKGVPIVLGWPVLYFTNSSNGTKPLAVL
jgi:hypothetical protein